MHKTTKKNNKYNSTVVYHLVEKYDLSAYYIRECLRGDRNSITSDKIRADYKKLVKELEDSQKEILKTI